MPTFHPKSGSVPIELSSFIGREAELAYLAKVQPTTRLLTLVGPGGVGKSRLALRLASATSGLYPGGIWFVEFAGVTDSGMVPQTLVNAIGVHERPGESALEAVARRLRNRRVLLILDNCEHLVVACSELAEWLLRTCPGLDIIATSREPLDAVGDILWRVPPLSLPSPTAINLDAAATSEAIQLFVERAQANEPSFELTCDNVHYIVSICSGLDGLPLALELVAARVGTMHESEIAARLGLDLVSRRDQYGPPRRQHTLKATLDWSYELLTEPDRVLLRRLSVFADGWTLKSAEAVCADEVLPKAAILDSLGRLVARSLAMFDRQRDCGNYYLLETVKQYARLRLDEAGETPMLRGRQLAYMVELAERELPEVRRPEHRQLLTREQENVRAALTWAVADRDAESGLRLAVAAFPLWSGRLAEGRTRLEQLLALPSASGTSLATRATAWLGQIAMLQGDYASAEASLREALAQHIALRDRGGAGLALTMLANIAVVRGDLLQASELLAEGRLQLQQSANPAVLWALRQSAVVAVELGDLEHAASLTSEAELYERAHNMATGTQLYLHGLIVASRGDTALAEGLFMEARKVGLRHGEHYVLHEGGRELGHVLLDLGRGDAAQACFADAIAEDCAFADYGVIARNLEAVARCAAPAQPAVAVRLAGAADGLRAARGAVPWPSDRRRLAAWLPDLRRRLKGSVYMTAWHAGRQLTADEAMTLARRTVAPADEPPRRPAELLTRRERDVLKLLTMALSNQQIAAELNISVATTRTHVDHILAKLELHSRTQVAVWANTHGLMQEKAAL